VDLLNNGCLQENVPGEFPYTAGFIRLKEQGEDPTRCLPGKADQNEPTDVVHLREVGLPAKRLSKQPFDSVPYMETTPINVQIFNGKIGMQVVFVCCLE